MRISVRKFGIKYLYYFHNFIVEIYYCVDNHRTLSRSETFVLIPLGEMSPQSPHGFPCQHYGNPGSIKSAEALPRRLFQYQCVAVEVRFGGVALSEIFLQIFDDDVRIWVGLYEKVRLVQVVLIYVDPSFSGLLRIMWAPGGHVQADGRELLIFLGAHEQAVVALLHPGVLDGSSFGEDVGIGRYHTKNTNVCSRFL